jgi:hypothetical protein
MTMINSASSLTAEDLALISDEQLEKVDAEVDRLRQLVAADKQRRREELASKFEVLGRDATATCLRHRRTVRWMASPVWWYHDPGVGHPEYRQCAAMLEAPAPLVWVDNDGKTMPGTGYLPPMVKLANRLAAKRKGE